MTWHSWPGVAWRREAQDGDAGEFLNELYEVSESPT